MPGTDKTYEIEEELRADAPRALPSSVVDELRAKRRRERNVLLAIGLFCVVLARVPFVETLADYVLPLRYLVWIGAACGAGWLVLLVARLPTGAYRPYVEGHPFPAVIRSLELAPTSILGGSPTHYAYRAVVEGIDDDAESDSVAGESEADDEPDTVAFECQSPPFAADHRDRYTCTYRVGDTVTALLFVTGTTLEVQLYGFLGMTPGKGLYRDDEAARRRALDGPLGGLLVAALFVALIWNVYAFARYQPLDIAWTEAAVPVGAGAAIGLLAVGWSILWHRRAAKRRRQRNLEAVERGEAVIEGAVSVWGQRGLYGWTAKAALFAGAPLLVSVTVWCWAISANALLDSSPPEWRAIEVVETTTATSAFILREHTLEFRTAESEGTHTAQLSPAGLEEMARATEPQAAIRAGALGWPWAAAFRPEP